ncbi:MAG: dipeptide ABC transporter ATP-binding protein [Sphingomonadales bacterium]
MTLSLEHVRVEGHGEAVVSGVSLCVDPGQVLGLVGESGSGKSMLLSAIMGLLPKGFTASGDITLEGASLNTLSEAEYTALRGGHVGLIFQEPMTALNPLMTIGAQVGEALKIHGQDGLGRVEAALSDAGLSPQTVPPSRYPHELSGGQRQRVATAIALACQPKLLLADEPTTALDVITQKSLLEMLKARCAEDGLAMIFVTHDLALVEDIADTIAVMKAGEIVEHGPAREVCASPQHPYTRALWSAAHWHASPASQVASSPVLEVVDMRVRYGQVSAIEDISFAVPEGSCTALIGPSGCGKSTLARAVMGLERDQSGRVLMSGEAFTQPTPKQRRAVQIVFQDPFSSFDPRRRVREILLEPFWAEKQKPERPDLVKVLKAVGLEEDALERFPHAFSGGQRQRIAIARALLAQPKLIILDEAVSGLDASVRAEILALLVSLRQEQGLAYLFITHDLGLLSGFADQVLIMESGRIVERGETKSVLAAPQSRYTQALIEASPHLEQA